MNLLPLFIISLSTLVSPLALAGVYKCTDDSGNTSYQSAPCKAAITASKINTTTGSSINLAVEEQSKTKEDMLKQQQEAKLQKQQEMEVRRIMLAKEQSTLNQLLVQNNPIRFTAFAIPPYLADELSATIKPFESRLPAIEKFRRLAAQKALATGECKRVESDELSIESSLELLVFSVDCSSAKTFQYTETELTE